MSVKKGLGRGFDSLIPTELLDESFDPTSKQDERVSDLRYIKLSEIIADPDQPRREFDEKALAELSESIKEHGILQPIVVRARGDKYMIVAGERRFRASEMAGVDKIPALVRTLSDQHKLELSLIENLQRRDLNPLETATAYLKLRDQFNMTLEQIGQRVGGKTVATVGNTLRLLRLPEVARKAIVEGKLTEGQARPLIGLSEDLIAKLVPKIIDEQWSARRIERYISNYKLNNVEEISKHGRKILNSKFKDDESRLGKRFSAPVTIRETRQGGGAGKIVIEFKDFAEFERIKKLLEK